MIFLPNKNSPVDPPGHKYESHLPAAQGNAAIFKDWGH